MSTAATYKLGKKAAVRDPRTLMLHDFIKLPAPPDVCDYHNKARAAGGWPLYSNDSVSDCGPAAAAHMLTTWTACAESATFTPDQSMVFQDYHELSGWDGFPGSPSDGGIILLEQMKRWRHVGMCGKKIFGFAGVNPRDHRMVESAIHIFGGVIYGVLLPSAVQGADAWRAPDRRHFLRHFGWEPGSWGGHAVTSARYDHHGLFAVTWGIEMVEDWGFNDLFCDEMYVAISEEWISDTTGKTPSDLDRDGLIQKIKSFG